MTESANSNLDEKKEDNNNNENGEQGSIPQDQAQTGNSANENDNIDGKAKEIGSKLLTQPQGEDNSNPQNEVELGTDSKPQDEQPNEVNSNPLDEKAQEIGSALLGEADSKPQDEQEKEINSNPLEEQAQEIGTALIGQEEEEEKPDSNPSPEQEDDKQEVICDLTPFVEQMEEKKRQIDLNYQLLIGESTFLNKNEEKETPPVENKTPEIPIITEPEEKQITTPPKSPENRSPRKKYQEIVKYDPSIFQNNDFADLYTSNEGKPSQNLVTDLPKLTVTLKDIGLEGLDSSTPDKAENIRKTEKEQQEKLKEKERAKSARKPRYKRQTPSPRSRKRFNQSTRVKDNNDTTFSDSAKINGSEESPKPAGLLETIQNAQKLQTVIPKTNQNGSPKANKIVSGSGSENGTVAVNNDEPQS